MSVPRRHYEEPENHFWWEHKSSRLGTDPQQSMSQEPHSGDLRFSVTASQESGELTYMVLACYSQNEYMLTKLFWLKS